MKCLLRARQQGLAGVCLALFVWLQPGLALAQDGRSTRVVVQALHQAVLSAEIAARITRMPLREGDPFKEGDVLITFDCDIFQAQLDKVQAEVKAAQARLDNNRELERSRSIGALEVLLSEVALQQTQAELHMATLNTQRCQIKAPWNGRVLQRKANVLEVAKLHQELLSIVSTGALEVMAVVPGTWIRTLKLGQMMDVRIDETGTRHSAEVIAIGSHVDAVSQTLNLRARIAPHPRLLPGMTGTATLR